ncbi:SGNH/GDSL hydrolase family protein [Mucilaginibacter ginsenosidivorax]|uniref:G-D-S-L family lipolytic protein n=1 Tax=Mucilaginibacter ginsenosidivorax TaxID=862126 RepID=A0A5B8WBS1_9SPHI|nr:SGNH/GDSL hydrolase family protein [Mucilaginibacter ginsenosidivorax]QEC79518.1 G-D-S-L family lipolytic protein [Mucilaginibacter ginsenosidivorax]
MKTLKQHIYIIAGLLLLGACKPEIHTPKPVAGSADFSRYISVGNSLTAGYADGGLYLAGQQVSYPSIIGKQMQAVGGGAFTQPLFSTAQSNGSGYLSLTGFNADGTPITTPVTTNLGIRGQVTVPGFGNVILYTKYSGDINNYGVPGIKLLHITYAPYGNLNGYFERLLPGNPPTNSTTYLDFVMAKPFTFFSNWLGNNDALSYATSGGAGDVLTDKNTFAYLYNVLITTLTAKGQKGVVATIPDVTSIPYFNTITVSAILAGVQKANPAAQALYIKALVSGSTYAPRAATTNDLIVLTFPTSKIGQPVATPFGNLPYGLTPYTPIDNQYVLDEKEAALTEDYVTSYNNTIKTIAIAKGLAIFDAYTFLRNIKQNGLVVDGVSVNSNYISGGLFSLDGVHLTPRGYAIVADEFIKAINDKYNSSIPRVNISDYNGVKFP